MDIDIKTIKDYKSDEGTFRGEAIGYFARLNVNGKPATCFVSGVVDCYSIGEIINVCGYTSESVLGRRVTISIEDES